MIKILIENLCFRYGSKTVLDGITLHFYQNRINTIVGPSGAGKSTLLLCINKLWELIPGAFCEGKVEVNLNGKTVNVNEKNAPIHLVRKKVQTVFQMPNPLPMSILNNLSFPLKLQGIKEFNLIEEKIEEVLKRVHLWSEVKDKLKEPALKLSVGQQQRLCIARALISNPEVLLLDEPTSALDKKNKGIIEDLLISLRSSVTIVLVSHFSDQIEKLSDYIFQLNRKKTE